MTEVLYGIVFAIVLGIYWTFVAPRLERAPRWFRVPFIVIGLAMIAGLILLVLIGIVGKYF